MKYMILFRIFALCLVCLTTIQHVSSQVNIVLSTTKISVDGKFFFLHTVQQGETLFSISRAYNVPQNDIISFNPGAQEGIRIGEELKIPVTEEVNDSNAEDVNDAECPETSKTEFRISMFLPLALDDSFPASAPNTTMTRDSEGRYLARDGRYWIHQRSANGLEFYQGALLAIDSLKRQGFNAQITLYDVARDAETMTRVLSNPEILESDLLIGPFTTEQIDRVTDFARENKIHYVSPTAISAASMRNNPFLLQVNAGEINTVAPMVNFIVQQQDIHVTLIGNTSESDQTLFYAYQNMLKTVIDENNLTVLQMSVNSLQQPNNFLRRGVMNAVIIPSSDEAFVNIITGRLNGASNNFQINVYGLAIWTKFLNLDLEYLYALEFRYATAFFIDYQRQEVRNFLRKYRNMYHTEPTMLTGIGGISPNQYQLAFLGYDVTFFFLSALKKYGENFNNCISNFRMNMLHSDFHFVRIDPESGFRNSQFDIYKYGKDYSIVKETAEN